ncbi:TIGR03557 family F420-dependent LLM class oxidoreductase [Pseudokineococcus sp. 5B2Z-1]|uniref:TIGR03557 family F420-dependent LLM class oxidoreductase n=1 Tax=Pseudokineococcus sp. 5B2Z-1 TaxID=3132744 RepID=UPI003099BF00
MSEAATPSPAGAPAEPAPGAGPAPSSSSGTASPSLTVGYAAMLEQFTPTEAVELTALAEQHGFSGCMAGDHFAPWVPQQGQAASIWPVLTAVGERTRGDFGSGVVAPGWRWHPAVVAQASATLAAMYPGRHWLGVGAGEALNEHVVAPYWPEGGERSARMFEAVELMKKLFDASLAGKDSKFQGTWYRHETTRLWTMPEQPPEVLVATAGPLNAKRAGRSADGLITVGAPLEKISGLFERFDAGAREAGKDPSTMPKVLQLHLSWAPTDEEALRNALVEWPNGGMKFPKADIRSPHDFAAMAQMVREEDFEGRMVISSDPDVHRAAIQRHVDLGFDRVYLHNVGRNQREWVEVFGREVLPALHR